MVVMPDDAAGDEIQHVDIGFVGARADPRELLRTCHALYLDYPSTYYLEATAFGKEVILDGRALEMLGPDGWSRDQVLLPGDAVERMIAVITRNAIPEVKEPS